MTPDQTAEVKQLANKVDPSIKLNKNSAEQWHERDPPGVTDSGKPRSNYVTTSKSLDSDEASSYLVFKIDNEEIRIVKYGEIFRCHSVHFPR